MPPPDDFDVRTWQQLMGALDMRLDAAARRYVATAHVTPDEVATGFSELAKLRETPGREPDYSQPGVPIAYALRYLPRRVGIVLAALTRIASRPRPRLVLDIGSGSDAVSLALTLWAPGAPFQIVAVEPSEAMRWFAEQLDFDSNVVRQLVRGTLLDIQSGALDTTDETFDLVTMSACLPYGEQAWNELAASIGRLTRSSSSIIAVEPDAKLGQLQSLRDGLDATSTFASDIICCHDLPLPTRLPLRMPRLLAFQSAIYDEVVSSPGLTRTGGRMLGDDRARGPFSVFSWPDSGVHRDQVLLAWRSGN